MSIKSFFAGIAKSYCPVLTSSVCVANSVHEFYDKCIKNTLPDVDVVKGWHDLLKRYIDDPDAVFFVRKYASCKDKAGKWNIRRGFLTVCENVKYVFVDNFFAQYFYAMAINGFVPDYHDFKQFVLDRDIPYGYSVISEERAHQAYLKGPTYPLNRNGWKLSHVFSANNADYNFDYKKVAPILFPIGEYDDFKKQGGSSFPYRSIDICISDEDIKRIKAHFLRVVHPLNHFLTPKTQYQNSSVGIKDIGEYPEMIDYMKFKLAKRYGSIFTEYMDLILAPGVISSLSLIGLKYGFGLGKMGSSSVKPTPKSVISRTGSKPTVAGRKKVSRTKTKKLPFTDNQIANSIKAYLFEGMSFRVIEHTFLGMPKRTNGGGWAAKSLLEGMGIDSSMKKTFDGKTVADAISISREPMKTTLKWMETNL